MQVFSCLLTDAAAAGKILYHPLCKEIKFTHICFADDLVIYLGGKVEDIQVVLQILELYRLSGLKLDPVKTEFHPGGLSGDSIANILLSLDLSKDFYL
ncbi:hypothetical protein NL676_008680 [Syzygium grande]|nr:hypothetical protein NL676_008680 [Syzygium grande]